VSNKVAKENKNDTRYNLIFAPYNT